MGNVIQFSSKSVVDDFGRVFFKENKVFRAIYSSNKDYCLQLLNSPLINELMEKGLIPKTYIAHLDDFDLVLEHERLVETMQHEWSFSMLRDAACLVLEVNKICNKYGYELKDGHTSNILFRGTTPVFIDLGSFGLKLDNNPSSWIAYQEFISSFMIPLFLWSEGKIYLVRKLLESISYQILTLPSQDISESGLLSLVNKNIRKHIFSISDWIIYSFPVSRRITFSLLYKFKKLAKLVFHRDIIKHSCNYIQQGEMEQLLYSLVPPNINTLWKEYHIRSYKREGELQVPTRFKRIIHLIKEKEQEISSIIDLAGNEGFMCSLINQHVKVDRIILTDYDSNAIDSAYNSFKKVGVNNIYTVLLNFMFAIDLNDTMKRLKSDVVLALAVTHHLILSYKYSLPAIFERVGAYSNKYVLIEFMPLGLWDGNDKEYPAIPTWYTVDWFRSEFEKHFVLLIEEQLEKNRILFMGKLIK